VIAITKVAALEHACDGIRVNAICPGPVRTPMSKEEGDASVDGIYVTGTELAIDGGYLAR
jgi:NAD(P)-dependent dehydrogenase (short-subunit alcohol dehydrogenase family)